MPYKNPEDKKENRKFKASKYRDYERVLALQRFRAMGLEPIDIEDQTSPLLCVECCRESARTEIYKERHETYCSYYAEKLPLLRYPVSKYAEA